MILLPDKPLDVLSNFQGLSAPPGNWGVAAVTYLARFGWQMRVEDVCVCVCAVILLAETKTTRQGDGCEELAINGWFPPFWGIFGCKKSQPVDGRNQKEIRMEAS